MLYPNLRCDEIVRSCERKIQLGLENHGYCNATGRVAGKKIKGKGGGCEINSHSITYNLKRSAVKKLNEIALNRNS